MKRYLLLPLAVISLSIGALIINACQKETRESVLTSKKGKEKPSVSDTKTCVHPVFCNKQIDAHCSQGHGCLLSVIPAKNMNRIRWTVGTQCSCSQSYSGTSYYTLYKRTSSTAPQYTRIATFNCTNSTMWYASSLLTNSSTFILLINETSAALPANIQEDALGYLYFTSGTPLTGYIDSWKFTTGNTAGTVTCIITTDPPGEDS